MFKKNQDSRNGSPDSVGTNSPFFYFLQEGSKLVWNYLKQSW